MEVEVREFGIRIRLIVEPAPVEKTEQKEAPAEPAEISADEVRAEAEPTGQVRYAPELERGLRNWRREEAVRRGIPTYIVMTERTIKEIVENPPADLETLRELKGIGPKTMELYGEHLMQIVQAHQLEDSEEE